MANIFSQITIGCEVDIDIDFFFNSSYKEIKIDDFENIQNVFLTPPKQNIFIPFILARRSAWQNTFF